MHPSYYNCHMIFATCCQIMPEHAAKKLQLVEITVEITAEITKSQLKSRDFEISYREIVCCQPLEIGCSKM